MLVDLLSSSNLISFNIKVAEMFGLHPAIYLSELIAINEKAIRKEKVEVIDDKQYFTINRPYITSRTTLTTKEQKEIEHKLGELKILLIKPETTDTVYLDINRLSIMLSGDLDTSVVNDISKLAKKKTKEELAADKRAGMAANAQKAVKTTNQELRAAYYNWIESVLDRYGTIKKATVTVNEDLVDKFANHDLNIALDIVNNTAIKGYDKMQYAIDLYKEMHPSRNKPIEQVIEKTVAVGKEAF